MLAACAGTEAPPSADAPRSGGADKFAGDARLGEQMQQLCPVLAISDFSDNTRETVVISMNKESYLIETRRTCYALRDAMGIGVPPGASCLRPGDQLVVTDAGPVGASSPMGTERCSINRIFRWTPANPPRETQGRVAHVNTCGIGSAHCYRQSRAAVAYA